MQKCQGEKNNLAVGDNGVSFTPVTDPSTARSLLMLRLDMLSVV